MSTRDKACKLLLKLYLMRKTEFAMVSVEDILARATEEEINYYYYFICVRRDS